MLYCAKSTFSANKIMQIRQFATILIMLLSAINCYAEDTSTKKERNFIKDGNEKYESGNYSEAEVLYKKALEQNGMSDIANFNKASALMKQSGNTPADSPNNPLLVADSIFNALSQSSNNTQIKESSFYNLGNIAFDKQDYQKSISMYKHALRINPNNDDARDNLRLAQLKLKEQQNNKDKNKDKNKDQDKQDNKDKQQNKDNQENQDQSKDNKQNEQKDEKNQDKQPQSPQQNQDNQQQKQQGLGISDANAEKILKTMENEENATRRKVNMKKAKEAERNANRRQTTNQW